MEKKMAVPMSDCRVDTLSSLGTGMKLKMSTFRSIRRKMLGCSSEMKEESLSDFYLAMSI